MRSLLSHAQLRPHDCPREELSYALNHLMAFVRSAIDRLAAGFEACCDTTISNIVLDRKEICITYRSHGSPFGDVEPNQLNLSGP